MIAFFSYLVKKKSNLVPYASLWRKGYVSIKLFDLLATKQNSQAVFASNVNQYMQLACNNITVHRPLSTQHLNLFIFLTFFNYSIFYKIIKTPPENLKLYKYIPRETSS